MQQVFSTTFSKFKSLVVVCFVCAASACSIVPETIEQREDAVLVPFKAANTQAAPQVGVARWGGEIIGVNNLKDYSEIEILHFPTNHYGKPLVSRDSEGRFKAKIKGFVDPLVFEEGRLVTVLGEVQPSEEGIIGEQPYLYPIVAAEGYHMWKQTEDVNVSAIYFSPFDLRWGSPYFRHLHWGFGASHRFFYNDRIRYTVKSSKSGRSEKRSTRTRSSSKSNNSNATSNKSASVSMKGSTSRSARNATAKQNIERNK